MPPDPGPSDRSAPRTPWAALVVSAIVVPTVLAGLTLLWPGQQIQNTLTERAGAALAAAGISGATVRFDGRDATLSGVSDAEAARAIQAVESATGVRVAQVAAGGGAVGTAPAPATVSAQASASAGASASALASGSASASAPASTAPAVTSVPAAAPAPTSSGDLDAAAKQALQAQITALTTAAPITFGGDSPQLTAQGKNTVAKVLVVVRAQPGARLQVDGYVAPGPGNGRLTAQQLSDQRAAAVRDALVAGGVPADHLTANGRGEDTTSVNRALGRRATITVV